MRFVFLILWSVALTYAAPPLYESGKKLYFSKGCNGCHGITASGTNQYPALAHRRKPFLEYKLKEFRAKRGATQLSQMMIPFALGLSDQEINALTTFLYEYQESNKPAKSEFVIRGDGGS